MAGTCAPFAYTDTAQMQERIAERRHRYLAITIMVRHGAAAMTILHVQAGGLCVHARVLRSRLESGRQRGRQCHPAKASDAEFGKSFRVEYPERRAAYGHELLFLEPAENACHGLARDPRQAGKVFMRQRHFERQVWLSTPG